MKRSEALKIIDDLYSKFVREYMLLDMGDTDSLDRFVPLNERILSKLEEAGMYPPDTTKEGHTVSEWDRE